MTEKKVTFKQCKLPEIPKKQFGEFYDNDYDKMVEDDDESPSRIIMTPFGIIPVSDDQVMKAYIGNTNFNFTVERSHPEILCDMELVENVDGVELLKVFSRYRFLITIGELFDNEDVLMNIKSVLCNTKETKLEILNRLIEKTKIKAQKYPYWAVLCLPNGDINTITSEEYNETFTTEFSLLTQIYKGVGGIFYSYLKED